MKQLPMNFHLDYSLNLTNYDPDYPRHHLLHFPSNNLNDAIAFVADSNMLVFVVLMPVAVVAVAADVAETLSFDYSGFVALILNCLMMNLLMFVDCYCY